MPGQSRHAGRCLAPILVRRRFNRVAAEPSGNEDHGSFPGFVRLCDDRSQSFAVWTGYRVINHLDIWIGFMWRCRLTRKVVCSETFGLLRASARGDYRHNSHLNVHLPSLCFSLYAKGNIFEKSDVSGRIMRVAPD